VINETFINYNNRDAGWQPDDVVWNDTAGIYAKDRQDPQTLDKQFITNWDLATWLCNIAGQLAALPANPGKLSLAFDAGLFAALSPGTGFTFTYAHRPAQSGVYRVISREIEDPAKPIFTLEVAVDRSYLYQPMPALMAGSGLGSVIPDDLTFDPFANYRILELPAALCPDEKPAIVLLTARDSLGTSFANLFLGRNYTFNGTPPDSFVQLQTLSKFAQHGVLAADFPAASATTVPANALPAESADWANPIPLTAGMQIQLDGPDLILPDVADFDALAGAVLVFIADEIMAVAEQTLTASGAYTLTVIRGAFGTAVADHAAGDTVFVIPRSFLVPIQHPHFLAGNTAEFKLTIGSQSVLDVSSFNITFAGTGWNFPVYLQRLPNP
jgi:hypothetical protein